MNTDTLTVDRQGGVRQLGVEPRCGDKKYVAAAAEDEARADVATGPRIDSPPIPS